MRQCVAVQREACDANSAWSTGQDFRFATDAGVISARFVADEPEIDLQPVQGFGPTPDCGLHVEERRMGFANTGVPHLVVLVDDVERVDVCRLEGAGAALRRQPGRGRERELRVPADGLGFGGCEPTNEGSKGETLACGTGHGRDRRAARSLGAQRPTHRASEPFRPDPDRDGAAFAGRRSCRA